MKKCVIWREEVQRNAFTMGAANQVEWWALVMTKIYMTLRSNSAPSAIRSGTSWKPDDLRASDKIRKWIPHVQSARARIFAQKIGYISKTKNVAASDLKWSPWPKLTSSTHTHRLTLFLSYVEWFIWIQKNSIFSSRFLSSTHRKCDGIENNLYLNLSGL